VSSVQEDWAKRRYLVRSYTAHVLGLQDLGILRRGFFCLQALAHMQAFEAGPQIEVTRQTTEWLYWKRTCIEEESPSAHEWVMSPLGAGR
jgi:hypothetical protein